MTEETRKLLVVEDDPGLQTQLKWCFEGYDVIIAGDRLSALAELEKHRPPVITLDLGLPPDADGTQEGFLTLEEVYPLESMKDYLFLYQPEWYKKYNYFEEEFGLSEVRIRENHTQIVKLIKLE